MRKTIKLAFLGDIICHNYMPEAFAGAVKLEDTDLVIANNEAPIITDKRDLNNQQKHLELYSTMDIMKVYQHYNVSAVNIATNHIQDYTVPIEKTRRILARHHIKTVGAGNCLSDATNPLVLKVKKQEVVVLAYTSELTGAAYASKNQQGCAPFEYKQVLSQLTALRKQCDKRLIIMLINWNYDMEKYPQPVFRELAKKFIDTGADGIIGFHPHIFQGGEIYNDKPIIYGMGNFYLSQIKYNGVLLTYPEVANKEAVVETCFDGRKLTKMTFHHHQYNPDTHFLAHTNTIAYRNQQELEKDYPMFKLQQKEYGKWYPKNRRINRLYPVFYHWTGIRYRLNKWRVKLIMVMVPVALRLGLKKAYRGA